jgi:hypothetical protein
MSDLSGQVFPTAVAKEWEERISKEFKIQSDKEHQLGIPTAPFMQNLGDPLHRAGLQVGFIEFVLLPYWAHVARVWPPLKYCQTQLVENKEYYEMMSSGKGSKHASSKGGTGKDGGGDDAAGDDADFGADSALDADAQEDEDLPIAIMPLPQNARMNLIRQSSRDGLSASEIGRKIDAATEEFRELKLKQQSAKGMSSKSKVSMTIEHNNNDADASK